MGFFLCHVSFQECIYASSCCERRVENHLKKFPRWGMRQTLFVEFFELFVAEIISFSCQEFLKIFRKILSWFLLHVCSHPRALTCLFLYLYMFVHFWRRVMNQNVSGKTRYCHKDNTTDQNSPPVVSMKRLFVVSKPYPHTSPGTLSSPPGLLRPSGAMSRRGAGVHARPTGGLRTEGLEWPSACTSAASALGGGQDSTMVNRFAKKTWNITANGLKRFLSEKWERVGRTDIFGSKNGPFWADFQGRVVSLRVEKCPWKCY